MTFATWLFGNYTDKQGEFGNFAREAGSHRDFPKDDNLHDLRTFAQTRMGRLDIFNRLWYCYERDLKNGAAEDEVFKTEYSDIFKLAWQIMKKAFRKDSKQERLDIWETGHDYYINHVRNGVPDFSAKLLDLVKDELIRDAEHEPITDIQKIVGND